MEGRPNLKHEYLTYWGIKAPVFYHAYGSGYFYQPRQMAELKKRFELYLAMTAPLIRVEGPLGCGKTFFSLFLYQDLPLDQVEALFLTYPYDPHDHPNDWIELNIRTFFNTKTPMLWEEILKELRLLNKQLVVFIDGAQRMTPEALKELTYLTELGIGMITFCPIGLGDLSEKDPLLPHFQQKLCLTPLQLKETKAFIKGALEEEGLPANTFTLRAIDALHQASGGLLGALSSLAEQALVEGFFKNTRIIDHTLLKTIAPLQETPPLQDPKEEVSPEPKAPPPPRCQSSFAQNP